MRRVGLILWLVMAAGSAAASSPWRVELQPNVTVASNRVRLGDLASSELPLAWDGVVVATIATPGESVSLSKAKLRRILSGAGAGVVPHLDGPDHLTIRRSGRAFDVDGLPELLIPVLSDLPLPSGATDQRWEITRPPRLSLPEGSLRATPLTAGPLVGEGNFAVLLAHPSGQTQRVNVGVRRSLLVDAVVLTTRVSRDDPLGLANCRRVPRWIESPQTWRTSLEWNRLADGVQATRSLATDHHLLDRDVRLIPDVAVGSTVEWIVQRGDLRVSMPVVARGSGRVGDWIHVKTPFGGRLQRARVLGPGQVGAAGTQL